MIRRFSRWQAKRHRSIAKRFEERPLLTTGIMAAGTLLGMWARREREKALMTRVVAVEQMANELQRDMNRVKRAVHLPDQPTQRERIRDDLSNGPMRVPVQRRRPT